MIAITLGILVASIVIQQYFSPNFVQRRVQPCPKPTPWEVTIDPYSANIAPPQDAILIKLKDISMSELRKLDHLYKGTTKGDRVHSIRKERVKKKLKQRDLERLAKDLDWRI